MIGPFDQETDLLPLRDLHTNHYNADVLMVLTDQEHAADLMALAHDWQADELGWLSEHKVGRRLGTHPVSGLKVLRACWY